MKITKFVLFCALIPTVTYAQTSQPPLSPQDQACQQRIVQLTGDALQWQIQAISLQRQLSDAQNQLAAVEKKPPETAPTKH